MDYQLVLQFHGDSLQNFSRLQNLESRLTGMFGDSEMFDGLDVGNHGANLFVYTDSPKRTFESIRPLLHEAESASGFTAAYRTVAEERFRILWPADASQDFNLR
ncbi:MAG: hypothetical protein PHC88_16745 [Terrimicrobiaceae bacterium]|nr:hypothetical protein [Terrimicrobiaceae bacterium]